MHMYLLFLYSYSNYERSDFTAKIHRNVRPISLWESHLDGQGLLLSACSWLLCVCLAFVPSQNVHINYSPDTFHLILGSLAPVQVK